jgi:hypothetical protein
MTEKKTIPSVKEEVWPKKARKQRKERKKR